MELFMPTRVILGRGCIKQNAAMFTSYGKKAFIVTGKTSAEKSGAIKDVTAVLTEQNISYQIFSQVENNPSVATCYKGGQAAKAFGAQFIIAIGGGSPMDAAKAIAAYAVNDMEPMDIFGTIRNNPLPLISVPLTAGTGSEVTPYSVLTVAEIENKKSFTHKESFSKVAFLDPNYLASLPRNVLFDTAADALSHAIESMLCKRASAVSNVYAEASLHHLEACIPGIISGTPDFETLLLASSLAGMAIAHTGTVVVHSMGYLLTYHKGVPHGRANAVLLPGFIKLCNQHVPQRLVPVINAFGAKDVKEFCETIKKLVPQPVHLTQEEANTFSKKAITAKNVTQNLWQITEAEEAEVYAALI